MGLTIPDSGIFLESSANAMAGLPAQAFAITLSGSAIEDMIACVQNGGDIQLALGSSPRFLVDDHETRIPKTSDPSGYDLFLANSENPSSIRKLPNPTMSILKFPKAKDRAKILKAPASAAKQGPARASSKSSDTASSRPAAAVPRDVASQEKQDSPEALLERSLANLAADKREHSTRMVAHMPGSKGRVKPTGKRLLEPQATASPRSIPPSPALSALGSPSLPPSANAAQEKKKRQRFPIIHELAAQELSRPELLARWHEGSEEEFDAALNKVADQNTNGNWVMKNIFWKELDVFEYDYADEEDRQKAISNAISKYDKSRVGTSDPLWQKLLPKAERGKGKCLSRLQAAIAKGPPPRPKPEAASGSGAESDSGSVASKKEKGGEPMSRSSSQASTGKKKLSASEAQAKRMLSTSKKPAAATTAKPAPKSAPAKAAAKGGATAKGGRVLSKEFVSESESSDDEVPLSSSLGKPKVGATNAAKPVAKTAEKPKAADKTKEAPASKPKPAAPTKVQPREDRKEKEKEKEKEKDTIRAQVVAKPAKPPAKRLRDADDDSSSSSGTPLSKRVKGPLKPLPAPAKARTASESSHSSRGTGPGAVAVSKQPKNTSPVKSSPLASSPPTNASAVEHERPVGAKSRERERERERDREPVARGTVTVTATKTTPPSNNKDSSHDNHPHNHHRSNSSTDSSGTTSSSTAKKRPATSDNSPSSSSQQQQHSQQQRQEHAAQQPKAKRPRPSPPQAQPQAQDAVVEMAARFRTYYARYEQLHHDVSTRENPDPSVVTDLLDMHERLSRMKNEIYKAVEAC